MVITGTNVRLEQWEIANKDDLIYNANNLLIWNNLRNGFPHPYTEMDAILWINHCKTCTYEEHFAIHYNNNICGCIGYIQGKDIYSCSAEIGYWIGADYWGKGIATEALRLILDYLFCKKEYNRLYARVFSTNIGSEKVLMKNGFKKEAVLKKAIFKNGHFIDEVIWSILKEDNFKQ